MAEEKCWCCRLTHKRTTTHLQANKEATIAKFTDEQYTTINQSTAGRWIGIIFCWYRQLKPHPRAAVGKQGQGPALRSFDDLPGSRDARMPSVHGSGYKSELMA